MKTKSIPYASFITCLLFLATGLTSLSAQQFKSIFNGKDLDGWMGKEQFWKVEKGAIVGETTKDNPTKGNTFLIWKGGMVQDFEFSCMVKFKGNNSGVQYRSQPVGDLKECVLRGYQADLHPKQDFFGMLYGEKFGKRGIIAKRGQKVDAKGDKDVKILGTVGDKTQLNGEEWNKLTVLVVGNRLIHKVNDVVTVDVTENHPDAIAKGHLGLQLHQGAPMRVEFKAVKYREISGKAKKKVPGAKPRKEVSKPSPRPKLESLVRSATSPARINIADGFKIDLLYSVPMEKQGSWVAMCMDNKQRLIVSDQYGGIYRFPIPAAGKNVDPASIEQITYTTERPGTGNPTEAQKKLPQIGHAQGLCYAFDSLYVVVNSRSSVTGAGVFRLLDTDGDDQFDEIVAIKKLSATGGEHGPHAILPAPDGKHLYVVMGNQTRLPEDYTHSRVPELWGEDQLFPSLQYFMKGAEAPLGHFAQIDPEGKTWEVMSTGFRNQYDAAVNREGELFTYDADMEWDMNTPWYRPTRVNHVIDGADFGWRTGSGKFMDFCSDTFGTVVDVGPGSPTGVSFGYGAKFPAKYQNAFFVSDWSYGKLYAVHLTPKGSSYVGKVEEFASAQPFPLTDLLVNPKDGAMYVAVGGRKVQSGLYRVTYEGKESTAPAKSVPGGEEARKRRQELERFVQKEAKPANSKQLNGIWISLGAKDRGIRHAARIALEMQPVQNWKKRLAPEKNPVIASAAMIALARVDAQSGKNILQKAMTFKYGDLKDRQQRLDILRSITLALTRGGQPEKNLNSELIGWLDRIYPADTPEENRDLSAIMQFLQAPSAAAKGVVLLRGASGQEEQIGYALNLRHLKNGWTPKLRETYFQWFVRAGNFKGGARLSNYLGGIKKDAEASVPKTEMTPQLAKIIKTKPKESGPQFTFEARSFVKLWTMKELTELIPAVVPSKRDFKNGRQMFGAGSCYACHRIKGEGGAVGPDLTSVGGKFGAYDLLESIVDPGKEISDQYGSSVFTTTDGTQLNGRIMNMRNNEYWVNTDMMKPSTVTKVQAELITSIEPSPVSMMPPGLINTMNKEDILDLLAYLISGGDRKHELFDR
jgi:putative heme-binding domain-containing protein